MCQIITLLPIHLQSKKTLREYLICMWNDHSCAQTNRFHLYSCSYEYEHYKLRISSIEWFLKSCVALFVVFVRDSRYHFYNVVCYPKLYFIKIIFCIFNSVTMPKIFSYIVQNGKQWMANQHQTFFVAWNKNMK